MEITVSREKLFDCLSAIMNVVPQRSPKPLLSNVFLEVKENKLIIFGTDFEVSIEGEIELKENISSGALGVNGKKFFDLLRELSGTDISMKKEGQRLVIRQKEDGGRYALPIIGEDELPTIPTVDDIKAKIKAKSGVILRMLSHTSYSTSPDISMISFTGVLWQIKAGEYRMVATDGHRLALFIDKTAPADNPEYDLLISSRSMNHLSKLLARSQDDDFEAEIGENRVIFRVGNFTFITSLIAEKFPNYEQVLPKDNDKIVEVQRDDLVLGLRRVGIFSSAITHMVRFSISNENLKLSATDPETGSEGEDNIKAHYEGETLDIGFSANDISEILRHIETEKIRLAFKTSMTATIVQPTPSKEGEEQIAVVMPLRLPED